MSESQTGSGADVKGGKEARFPFPSWSSNRHRGVCTATWQVWLSFEVFLNQSCLLPCFPVLWLDLVFFLQQDCERGILDSSSLALRVNP